MSGETAILEISAEIWQRLPPHVKDRIGARGRGCWYQDGSCRVTVPAWLVAEIVELMEVTA